MSLDGIKPLSGNLWRVVEGQHVIATRNLVDSTEEHDLLERLIDTAKPAAPAEPEFAGFHYLLTTPFRYPPLRHGSRFATRHERSIFYGSVELRAAFAETAYYRLVFLEGTKADLGPIETDLSAFKIGYRTRKGMGPDEPQGAVRARPLRRQPEARGADARRKGRGVPLRVRPRRPRRHERRTLHTEGVRREAPGSDAGLEGDRSSRGGRDPAA